MEDQQQQPARRASPQQSGPESHKRVVITQPQKERNVRTSYLTDDDRPIDRVVTKILQRALPDASTLNAPDPVPNEDNGECMCLLLTFCS